MMRLGKGASEIEPLSASNSCTPRTGSAHMLYENSDPFQLIEPGGVLDVTASRYIALDDRTVRVDGSRFDLRPYSMKLEGASGGAFQTIMLVGIAAPDVMAEIDRFVAQMKQHLRARVAATM